ncbi:MAG TPA: PEP-CTERM sorting domain-containing protein [Chthoniobacteraceae bacterium]
MKKSQLTITLAALALPLVVLSPSTQAATLTFSGTAPTVDATDAANFIGATFDAENIGGNGVNAGGPPNNGAANDESTYVAFDRPAQGQTFTTAGNISGYLLNSVTLRLPGYTNNITGGVAANNTYFDLNNVAGSFTIRVGTITAGAFTQIATETAASGGPGSSEGNSANGPGTWLTYTFAAPITLAANTNYAFDIATTAGGQFFETLGIRNASAAGGDAYSGGSAFNSGDNGSAGTIVNPLAGDRVFHADLLAVPEPTSVLMMLSGLGVLLGFQRSRNTRLHS